MALKKPGLTVILNGPPGVGKDTIGALLAKQGFAQMSFKSPMFNIALAASGLGRAAFFERYNDRNLKEVPWDVLGGLSCRQFLIKISEEWIKPLFGKQHFGALAADAAKAYSEAGTNVVFTDGGFPEELDFLKHYLGTDHVLLVRLHREGYTFEGDSRDYLYQSGSKEESCWTKDINIVEGKPELAVEEICVAVAELNDLK